MTTIVRAATMRILCAILVTVALQTGMLAAQQRSTAPGTRSPVLDLAHQGQFEAADRAIELELASQQADYDLFWQYLSFLTNEANEATRAVKLGQKWLPAVRREKPQALGRILKETAVGILFGRFRETHLLDDRSAAKALLEEAIETNPDVMEAYIHLALLASLEGQGAASLSLLGRAVETATNDAQREELGKLRDRAGQEEGYLLTIARGMYDIDDQQPSPPPLPVRQNLANDPGNVPPLDCAQGKVCREPKTGLPARVLTRPYSNIYKSKDNGEHNIEAADVKAFSPLYVFARDDVDLGDPNEPKGWYQIGVSATGTPLGWMQAKDVVEWRQAIIAAFTNPGAGAEARKPVVFFGGRDALATITGMDEAERSARAEELARTLEAAVAGRGEPPDGVVSVEPGPFVDITDLNNFYMLPVLQFEDLGTQFDAEARHLQVVAVSETRAEPGEAALPPVLAGDAAPAGLSDAPALKELGVDVVFVMDMTSSMGPYILNATQAITDLSRQITQNPELAKKVRFGFVGYRDDVRVMPNLEFTSKNFAEDGFLEVDRFLQLMGSVNAEMDRFIAGGMASSSGDYAEEMVAGVRTAIASRWSEPSLRIMILVGDASSHPVGHAQNTTGLDAPQLRQELNAAHVNLLALHLRDARASEDHSLAEAQFTALAINPALEARVVYYKVDARDSTAYAQAVKDMGATLVELLAGLHAGDVAAIEAAAAAPAAPAEAGSTTTIKRDVAALGLAAALPYLTKVKGVEPPRDFTAWAFDRDLGDPRRAALEPRVLLDRDQVNDLVFTAEKVSQAIKTAELTQKGFFEALQSVATIGAKGEPLSFERAEKLRGSGLAAAWIESLPYKSAILNLNDEVYAALSPGERSQIEQDLDAKLEVYRSLLETTDIWVKPNGERTPPGEELYPLELASLP
jgi:serine/threonine-protein kinase PpkA